MFLSILRLVLLKVTTRKGFIFYFISFINFFYSLIVLVLSFFYLLITSFSLSLLFPFFLTSFNLDLLLIILGGSLASYYVFIPCLIVFFSFPLPLILDISNLKVILRVFLLLVLFLSKGPFFLLILLA